MTSRASVYIHSLRLDYILAVGEITYALTRDSIQTCGLILYKR